MMERMSEGLNQIITGDDIRGMVERSAPPKLHHCPYCNHRRFLTAERMELHIREKHRQITKALAYWAAKRAAP